MTDYGIETAKNTHWKDGNFTVYAEGGALDVESVLALKTRFREDPSLGGKLAVHIVDTLVPKSELLEREFDSYEADELRQGTLRSWEQALGAIVETPGAEWVIGVQAPPIFLAALQELDSLEVGNG